MEKERFKKCNNCGKLLPISQFNIGNYTSAGNPVYRGICKICQSDRDKKARLKRMDKKPNLTKICPSCHKELNKNEFNLNKGSTTGLSTYCKSCSKEKDKIAKAKQSYKIKHSHNQMIRYNLKKGLKCDFSLEQWEFAIKYFNNKCVYCGCEFADNNKPQYEHFIPISKNGTFTANNILPACKSCNSSKGNKDYAEWAEIKNLSPDVRQNIEEYFAIIKTIPSQITN